MKNRRYRVNIWATVAIVLGACLCRAAASSRTLSFQTAVKLNGADLRPGFYEVQWISHSPEATVTFKRNGKIVATAAANWVERETKYEADGAVYTNNPDGSHTLLELRFGGMKQVLVFARS
jgi:hypothetical protein